MYIIIDKLIEPDSIDEMRWYRMDTWGKSYAVNSCCRSCATKRLRTWTYQSNDFVSPSELGKLKTDTSLKWLVAL